MNAILTKERRSLRPALFATAIATVAVSLLCNGVAASSVVITAYGIGVVLMAASAFGNEFHMRTMMLLLSQPMPRRRVWFDKMRELALELVVSYVVLVLSLAFLVRGEGRLEHFPLAAAMLALAPLIAFCSAPFWSLSTKNMLLAMITTVALPWGLAMLGLGADWLVSKVFLGREKMLLEVADERHPGLSTGVAVIAALVYCAVLYRAGYRVFLNYQLVESQPQELRLPQSAERVLGRWMEKLVPGYTGPFASLLRKELRLQRVNYIVAGLTLVVMPVVGLLWKIHSSELTITLAILPIVLCAFGIPFISGLAMAEERNIGVLTSQLTLPVSPRKQWTAKALVALFTSVTLGVILPATLLLIGNPDFRSWVDQVFSSDAPLPLLVFTLVYLLAFALVVYAATFSTNVTRGMVAAVGLLAACGTAGGLSSWAAETILKLGMFLDLIHPGRVKSHLQNWAVTHNVEFNQLLFQLIWADWAVMMVLAILALWLLNRFAFANFRSERISSRSVWKQLAILICMSAIIGFVGQALVFLTSIILTKSLA